MSIKTKNKQKSVALVAPLPPPYGGMAVQAQKLRSRLEKEEVQVIFIASNPEFPRILKWCERIPGLRTFIRLLLFVKSLSVIKRADVVHLFAASHLYFFLVVAPTVYVAKFFNKRIVLNYRGGEAECFLGRWGRFAVPFFKAVDSIVVPSAFLQDVFCRCLNLEASILPNLADTEVFSFRPRESVRPLLVVSRQLEPLYNHETILKAFRLIKERYPEARLAVAGAGSEKSRLQKLCNDFELEGVEFFGALTHEQLACVYESSDIMVNASRADNFPGAIIEAFLCGLPVVTSNVGGIPHLVRQEVSGVLVEPEDYKGLAEAVINLVEQPEVARRLIENGRRIAECYRWENIRVHVYEAYGFEPVQSV
jgi:glycosyltransferase involved in cell wall biosynthesis